MTLKDKFSDYADITMGKLHPIIVAGEIAVGLAVGIPALAYVLASKKIRSMIKKSDRAELPKDSPLEIVLLSEEDAEKCRQWKREYPQDVDEIYYSHDGRGYIVSKEYGNKRVIMVHDDPARYLKESTEVLYGPNGIFKSSTTRTFDSTGRIIAEEKVPDNTKK